jgi:hypothetical protein
MQFEARDLKSYAEPVPESELKEGSEYFSVTFVDDAMCIPIINTVVFVGRGDQGRLRFQDIESYRQGVRYHSVTDDNQATFYECAQGQANNIFEYEHALDVLMHCSLRRRKKN